MSTNMKRKLLNGEAATTTNKRQKSDGKEHGKKSTVAQDASVNATTTFISFKEQPAFPRGGAGLLTPLEKKQISARASRDAAAEQQKPKDLFTSRHTAADNSSDDEANPTEDVAQTHVAKKRTKTKGKNTKDIPEDNHSVSIEGLSYKRLAIGSLILGRISAINSEDLTISLPNNLVGFVPLTSISDIFNEKIEHVVKDGQENAMDDNASDQDDENQDSDISLASHFFVGQYLRVAVTSLGDESPGSSQTKRKIVLSINPKKTNVGLTKGLLTPGCSVQAVVTSVEDHGLAVDLAMQDEEIVKGFVPAKTLTSLDAVSTFRPGAVLLCSVIGDGSSGRVVKLSADLASTQTLKNAPSIDAFLPGTQVEVLVSNLTNDGIAGKVMGLLDVTADTVHSGSYRDREAFVEKYKIGQKVKGRLISTFPNSDPRKLGFSVLDNVMRPQVKPITERTTDPALKPSSIVSAAVVIRVAHGLGIYLSLPSENIGFAHMSRLADKKIDTVSEISGAYKLGSEHKARVLDFNPVDGVYILSLEKKVIEQPFLKVDDVTVGETVKATITKILIGQAGVQGLIVSLAEGVTGLIPYIHMSDITLLHPEKKFREGQVVKARVLSVNLDKRQIRLTLKKTLVNSDQKIWTKIEDIEAGESTIGTLVKVDIRGALVQFYGTVRGFLPVAEMSEAYIKDATEHFKVGQVLAVNALSINAEEKRLTVSCRDRGASLDISSSSVTPGTMVSGTVFEKSQSDVLLRLEGSDVIARLAIDHVSDGSDKKRRSALDKIRVGQKLTDVLVLDVQRTGRLVILCNRQSLIKAAQDGQLLKTWEELKEGMVVTGYVSNITDAGVFVRFASGINGLITKNQVAPGTEDQESFGLTMMQAVTARVTSIDYRGATPRFWLSMKQPSSTERKEEVNGFKNTLDVSKLEQPVDETISSFSDFTTGKIMKARITSVKETQINVELAKDIHGRIDVSEIFDQWDDIKDRKQPLKTFNFKQVLPVRILGAHDTRNHRFLPLTHRTGRNTVFELSAKPSNIQATEIRPLSLADMKVGSTWLAFVNNIVEDCVMVNISPTIRGRIRAPEVSDDLSLAADLEGNFPLGSAIRVKVKSVNLDKNHLDLTGKSSILDKSVALQNLSPGMILPGRITKITDRSIFVQLADDLVGAVDLIDMADDYSLANTALYQKNDVLRVCVVKVDVSNKRIILSTRPSKVLSSSMKATDTEVTSVNQVKVGNVMRGFISNVADKGVFVTLGHGVTAFVRVTNLSDTFLKSWKDSFQRDQLVTGKVISVDEATGHIQLSLKDSVVSGTYKPPVTFTSIETGDVVTGKVVKVETFGVFILVDNSENVRGLCHRSEIAEQRIEDASKLFNQGDVVKAKVLKLDLPNRRINFGMKAAYFDDGSNDEEMKDIDDAGDDSDGSFMGGVEVMGGTAESEESANESNGEDSADDNTEEENEPSQREQKQPAGLSVGGFDWYGMSTESASLKHAALQNSADQSSEQKKKKKRKSEIQIDRTGDLDVNGPQSTDDYERLLLGEPNSSILWLQYMAFYLELGDVDAARQIGERALSTIGLGQDSEKFNIWIALLNLENAYGDDDSIDVVFKRALAYCEPQELYGRLVSIFIQSGKHKKADELFQDMLKKFTQDPKVYINYATFLFDTMNNADRGRAQLTRALQVLPSFTHFDLTSKFAQLEFKSSAGVPERGRTIFEGLINSFPKRVDLFSVLLDHELKNDDKEVVRALFERIFTWKLKPKQAKYFFKRWLAFEEAEGDDRKIEEVKAKAAMWVKSQA